MKCFDQCGFLLYEEFEMRKSEENDAKVRIGGVVRTVCARERGRESKGG